MLQCPMIAGDFVKGERSGYGVQFYDAIAHYEGEWLRNQRHGWGRMTYQNGDYYEVTGTIFSVYDVECVLL